MIKNINILRVEINNPLSDPIQLSDNQQLSINNGDLLTILDPKLPSLPHSINIIKDNKILDPKGLYNINSILHEEDLESFQTKQYQKLIVETEDEPFDFNIAGIKIASHSWSPAPFDSKDNLLGILLNTSELLILKRSNNELTKYELKFNIFEHILQEMELNLEREEILINKEQYNALKIKNFSFDKIDVNGRQIILLHIISNAGFSTYQINEKLERIGFIPINNITTHKLSCWTEEEDFRFTGYLALVTSKNEVVISRMEFEGTTSQITNIESLTLKKPSRFLVSQIKWVQIAEKTLLIVTSSKNINIYDITDLNDIKSRSKELERHYLVVGIIETVCAKTSILHLHLCFEEGSVESYGYNLNQISLERIEPFNPITQFINRSLYKFQLINSTGETSNSEIKQEGEKNVKNSSQVVAKSNELTRPYLNQVVEGTFINYGIKLNDCGVAVIAYKIIPKNVLNYTILSKNDLNIGFINIDIAFEKNYNNSSSIAFINRLLFKTYQNMPPLPRVDKERLEEEIESFLNNYHRWKDEIFGKIDDLEINFPEVIKANDLNEYLIFNFTRNKTIIDLQRLFTFNLIFIDIMTISSILSLDKIIKNRSIIHEEQTKIEYIIRKHFMNLIIQFEWNPIDDYDKFLLINYYLFLHLDSKVLKNIPSHSQVAIQTKFFKESFEVSTDSKGTNFDSITSTSNHAWSRCKLTLLPLLELNNKVDELKLFNYLLEDGRKGPLAQKILKTINYCHITGNRTFPIN